MTDLKRHWCVSRAVILGLTVLAVAGTLVLGKWALSIMELLMGGEKGTLDRLFWGICRDRSWRRVLCPGKSDVLRTGDHAQAEDRVFCILQRQQQQRFSCQEALSGTFGINGAALCYLLLMAGETAGFGLCTVSSCRSEEKEKDNDRGKKE